MEQRLTIVTLGIKDLEVSNDFYENKFGWKKTKSSNDNISFFQLNGILLALYPKEKLAEDAGVRHNGSGFKGFSLAFNTRSKKEVDELINKLEGNGVEIVKRPESVVWGGYSSYISDPDENLWEIAFNPYLELDENGNIIKEK